MLFHKNIAFLLLFCLPYNSWTQTLTGKIITEEQETVNFAIVSIYQLPEGNFVNGILPDDNGQFTFNNLTESNYQLVIDGGLGFQSDTLTIEMQNTPINLGTITLSYQVQQSVEATVTAEKIKPAIEHDIDKTTINVEGTALATFPSTINILQIAPAVSVVDGKISVLGKNNILLLVNGRRTALKLENIPAGLIESIEVVTNPSAEYDASVEAVINVKLKKGSLEGVHGNVYAKYTHGQHPRANAGLSLSLNKGAFSADLNLDYDYQHRYLQTTANRAFESNSPAYYSSTLLGQDYQDHNLYTNLDLTWNINTKHALTLSGEYSLAATPQKTITQVDEFFSTPEHLTIDSAVTSINQAVENAHNYQFQLAYTGQLSKEFSLKSAVSYLGVHPFKNNQYNFDFRINNNSIPQRQLAYQMNDSTLAKALVGQADITWEKGDNKLQFGTKYTNLNTYYSISFDNVNALGRNNLFKYDENIYALYLKWVSSWKTLQWSIGFRGEYATTSGIDANNTIAQFNQFNYFPSAAVLYMPSEEHAFKLSYSKSIQRVNFFDRSPYVYFTSLYTNFEGNPNLRPQITHSVDFTYFLMDAFTFTLHYNEKIDYINQMIERRGSIETFRNINFQSSDFGLTIGGQLQLTKWWQLIFDIQGVGLYTRGTTQGQPFDTWSGYATTYLMQSFNLWNWMSLDAIVYYTTPYSVGIYNADHLVAVDVNLRKSFLKDKFTASIYVSDVFGTNIQRNSIDFNSLQMNAIHNNDVRTVTLSLSYNFSKGRSIENETINTIDDKTLNRLDK